ncbi:hypothetical protein QAD02_004967 [Eretmocerus hayati]|uniref:Uncharacterized protein n=1 Tax=Eretmocerus hayati TaxID=131215 RepID=A0ACC2NR09_9HYME|nr:hypothetical protein QAD02_004967 [Eretmocerus hayati]
MCLCLGPSKSGKTMLLKKLRGDKIDESTQTIQTDGVNIYRVRNSDKRYDIMIRELGGNMAPTWNQHLEKVQKVMYVVDTSNLCQISAAGVLLYSLLIEPKLETANFALILTKMDLSYRQMRNEALLMLHFFRLQKEVHQKITVFETSGVSGQGIEELRDWIFDPISMANLIRPTKNT